MFFCHLNIELNNRWEIWNVLIFMCDYRNIFFFTGYKCSFLQMTVNFVENDQRCHTKSWLSLLAQLGQQCTTGCGDLAPGSYIYLNIYSHDLNFISSVRCLSWSKRDPTFSNFSYSSDSKVKVKVKVKGPNMCYIFEKHGIQGYRI